MKGKSDDIFRLQKVTLVPLMGLLGGVVPCFMSKTVIIL